MTHFDEVLTRLRAADCRPEQNGDGWRSYCPTHEARVRTLYVRQGNDGLVTARCGAGCDLGAICEAIGLDRKLLGTTVEEHPELQALEAATYDTASIKALPPPEPLVEGILDRDSLVVIFGPSGDGKSFLGIDLTCSVTTGTAWNGRRVCAGPVVYVVAEGASGIGARIDAWEQHHDSPSYQYPVHWLTLPVNLLDPNWARAFVSYCESRVPALVILDTLARCMVGGDENTPKDMGVVVDALDRVKRSTRACVAAVHHTGKDRERGARGHSSLKAAVDTEIEVTASDTRTTLRVSKQKNAEAADPMHLDRTVVGPSCVLVPASGRTSLSGKSLETLAALRRIEIPGGVPATQWRAAASGVAERTFYEHRALLLQAGQVRKVGTEGRPLYVVAYSEEDQE